MKRLQILYLPLLILLALRAEGQVPVDTYTELISPLDSHRITAAIRMSNGDLLQAGLQNRRFPSGVSVSVGGVELGDPSLVYYRRGQGVIQRVEWDQSFAAIHDIAEGPHRSLFVFGSYRGTFTPNNDSLSVYGALERSFALRLDSSGNILWIQAYGDTIFSHRSGAIAGTFANDTLYEVGIFNTVFSYVIKRDPNNGEVLDSLLLPARSCSDIEVNDQGHMAISGTTDNGVFPGLSLPPPSLPANYFHYLVVLNTAMNGLWGQLTPYISFDVEDQIHRSNDDLVHQALIYPDGVNNPEKMLLTKYDWQGNLLRADSLPYSSTSFHFNANDVLVRGNEYFTFVYDPYTRVEVYHFNGATWTEEGYFTGSFFLPLYLVSDGPEDLWIAGCAHMPTLTVNGDTTLINPHFPNGSNAMHRYWIQWDRTTSVSVDETQLPDLRIGPNPTEDLISIQLPSATFRWELKTLEGAHLAAGKGYHRETIYLDGLSAGYYLLIVEANGQRRVERIVKRNP